MPKISAKVLRGSDPGIKLFSGRIAEFKVSEAKDSVYLCQNSQLQICVSTKEFHYVVAFNPTMF